jgi:hypothetical protein
MWGTRGSLVLGGAISIVVCGMGVREGMGVAEWHCTAMTVQITALQTSSHITTSQKQLHINNFMSGFPFSLAIINMERCEGISRMYAIT